MFYRVVTMFILGSFLALGVSFATPAGATPTGGSTSPDWVGQAPLPQGMTLSNIECLTADFCKAVFDNDSIIGWDGTEWVVEYFNPASSTPLSIACASENLCKAAGVEGFMLSWNGQSWVEEESNSLTDFAEVVCFSETLCKAVGGQSSISSWNGTTWVTETTPGNLFTGVACSSQTSCRATSSSGIYVWDGTSWVLENPTGFSDITCPTATFCMAVRPMLPNPVYLWNGSNWLAAPDFPLQTRPGFAPQIECATPTNCLVLSMAETGLMPVLYQNFVWAWTGSWNPVVMESNLAEGRFVQDVTCFGASSCKVVFQNSKIALWNGTNISYELNGSVESFNAVHCPAVNLCKAVGNSGLIKSWNGTTWTEEESNVGENLYSVACPSTTSCLAMGENGAWLTWDGTEWHEESLLQPDQRAGGGSYDYLTSLTCPSTTLCKAIGQLVSVTHSNLLSWNGTEWTIELTETDAGFQHTAVSCPTTSFCLANGPQTMLWDGTDWTETMADVIDVFDCVSATFCKGYTDSHLYHWDGTAWTQQDSALNITSVDCVSETFCQASNGEMVYSWDGTAWTAETVTTSTLNAVSCFSANFCVGVGRYGTMLSMVAHTLVDVSPEFEVNLYNYEGCIAPLTITQVNSNHPQATADMLTGRYWTIETEKCVTEIHGQITLPTSVMPEPADMVCAYNGRLWVCEPPTATSTTTYTIDGLLPLADVTIKRPGPNASAHQQFLPLIQR